MTPSNPIRFTQALVLAVIVFALAVPAVALGSSNQSTSSRDWFERYAAAHPFGHGIVGSTPAPDVFERYAATHATTVLTDGRSPDTRDAAAAAQARLAGGPSQQTSSSRDWFERYAAAHPFGHGLVGSTPAPDVFERYAATHATTVLTDGRSPDTRDAAEAARLRLAGGPSQETLIAASGSQPTGIVRPGGFDWGDASLGAGAALGLILLVGAAGYTLRHRGRVLIS